MNICEQLFSGEFHNPFANNLQEKKQWVLMNIN